MRSIIALKYAVADAAGLPSNWSICANIGDLSDSCAQSGNLSVILSIEDAEGFGELVRNVYLLRVQFGEKLAIIVRELSVRLRYQEEAILASCGVTLIVPAVVGFARFLSMVEVAGNQNFGALLPADLEHAIINGGSSQQLSGYLPPSEFVRQVRETIARSHALSIDNAVVGLSLVNGLRPIDALRHCRLHRAGDIVTADRTYVWLFFYACREFDLAKTTARVFALPVDEFCSAEQRYLTTFSIQGFIDHFSRDSAGDTQLDLSGQLQASGGTVEAYPLAPAGNADIAVHDTVSVLPLPHRTPLRLR